MPATKSNKPVNKKSKAKKSTANMVKTSTPASAPASTPASAPASAPALAPTPVPDPTPVKELEPVPPIVVNTEVAPNELTYSNLEEQFASLYSRLQELRTLETSIMSDLRKLQKVSTKYIKDIQRKNKKKRPVQLDENGEVKKRPPSGFAKPALISNELCNFLGCPNGTEMARTEVTKFLTHYIKEHNLQDQVNRRHIIPDKKLQALLNVGGDGEEKLTYFNLQKYMKVHFPASKKSLTSKA
jgi:chromatin remodeling complex protein RSC6